MTIDSITREIRRRKHENPDKPYIAIIDYLQLIIPNNVSLREDLQIAAMTRELKLLTNELNIPIIQLSQFSRASQHRQNKRPTKADLKGSSSIEQDSNIIMFLHKEEKEEDRRSPDHVELIVAKSREGMTGVIDFRYHGATMFFEEMD